MVIHVKGYPKINQGSEKGKKYSGRKNSKHHSNPIQITNCNQQKGIGREHYAKGHLDSLGILLEAFIEGSAYDFRNRITYELCFGESKNKVFQGRVFKSQRQPKQGNNE